MQCRPGLVLGVLLVASAAGQAADEFSRIVETVNPPKRFAEYTPKFSAEKETHTFQALDGQWKWDFYVVKDRGKYVAIIPMPGFHSGTIYMQSFRPDQAREKLHLPSERWHIDTAVGTELQTTAWIPAPQNTQESTFRFEVLDGGRQLKMIRHFAGKASYNRWAHRDKKPQQVDVTNTFTFRVDPQLGYVVEGVYDVRAERFPSKYQFTSHAQSGRYSVWPAEASCFRNICTPIGEDGYRGYYMNQSAISSGRLSCRDGGFVGFLNDKTGWSTITTNQGTDSPIGVCNAHADLDLAARIPKDLPADENGMKHWVQRHRLLAAPPEVTQYLWDKMDVMFEGQRKLLIRLGQVEDFDDQPLPMTTRHRGLIWTGGDPKLADVSRGGKGKSLQVSGRAWPNIPQIALKPNRKYILEAWVLVEPFSAEELAARNAARKQKTAARNEKIRRDNQKRAEKNKPPRPLQTYQPLTGPTVYIKADYYQWTPHNAQRQLRQTTNHADPEQDGWQRIHLEFTTPAWGPFVDLAFVAEGCTAYFDDFRLAPVEDGPARAEQ
jgi:hypothetical protein